MRYLIGTSGWQYDDWIGRFYPRHLADAKHRWLEYYGQFFETTEINSSFYNVPSERAIAAWIRKGTRICKEHPFEFSLKMHREVTHEAFVDVDTDRVLELATAFERRVCAPLADEGLLGAVLIQLSPYVQLRPKNRDALLALFYRLFASLDTGRYDYAVEFRHRSFLGEPHYMLKEAVQKVLDEYRVASVSTDQPGFPWTRHNEVDHAYIRLHGRNQDIWFARDLDPDDDPEGRMNRYDYLYSDAELKVLRPRFEKIGELADRVRIYLNNHPRSKSVVNAFSLMDLLEVEHPPIPEIDLDGGETEQRSIFDYAQ